MESFYMALLLTVVGTLLVVPLLPAINELRQKTDVEPLNVIQQHAGEIRHFAQSFASVITQLEPALERSRVGGDMCRGVLPDGSPYVILGKADQLPELSRKGDLSYCPYVIAFSNSVSSPGYLNFERELYARGDFSGGEQSHYRAVLATSNVRFGRRSTVLRWAHAGSELVADGQCELYGRISAEHRIQLSPGCGFLRLNAPRIDIGRDPGDIGPGRISRESPLSLQTPRLLYDGDVTIETGEVVRANLVTRGKLQLRPGARVIGSVKSNKDLIIENEAIVEGSVICAERMIVGSRCTLHGPVIAERSITLYDGTVCGDLESPTTVSSPEIEVQEGVVVFGTLWARHSGTVWSRA